MIKSEEIGALFSSPIHKRRIDLKRSVDGSFFKIISSKLIGNPFHLQKIFGNNGFNTHFTIKMTNITTYNIGYNG